MAIVALIALALGLAIGIVLGGDDGPHREEVRVERAARADDTDAPPAVSSDGPPPPRRRDAPRSAARPARSADAGLLERAIATIPPPELPPGEGRITGRVLTNDSRPLAGITVVAVAQSAPGLEPGGWKDRTVVERVRHTVQSSLLQESSRRETVTDADGRFTFEGLSRVPYSITGESDHHRIWMQSPRGQRATPDATVTMSAQEVVTLRLSLTLADGSVPEQAKVLLKQGDHIRMQSKWNASSGTVKVSAGTYRLTVTSGESDELSASVESLELVHGTEQPPIEMRLVEQPGIYGRVEFPEGIPLPGRVSVAAEPVTSALTPETVAAGKSMTQVHQHAEWRFALTDLPPGRYMVVAWSEHGRRGVLAHDVVELDTERVEANLVVAPPSREDHLEVIARDADGNVVPGIRVSTTFRSKRNSRSGGSQPIKRPDGSVWVRHVDHGPGTYGCTVSHPAYGAISSEYVPGPSARVEVRFEPPATANVTVKGADDLERAAGLSLRLLAKRGDSTFAGSAAKRADGVATVGPIQPGDARLTASVKLGRRDVVVASRDIRVHSGTNDLTIAIPSLHPLRIECEGIVAGANHLRLSPKGERTSGLPGVHISEMIPASRVVLLRFLPAGDYELRIGRERRNITVPGTDVVRF